MFMYDIKNDNIQAKPEKTKPGNMNYIEQKAENRTPEVITIHTIDNITYTIKSRLSANATQSLRDKLKAGISRDIAKSLK
jgi:hypothetical protein